MSSTQTTSGTTFNLQYKDQAGNAHNIPYPFDTITRRIASRSTNYGRIFFIEDFRAPTMGMYSDGAGSAHRDCEVMFANLPTARLDPQSNLVTGTNPGIAGPNQQGVVFKSRIKDNFSGSLAMEYWLRFTSGNIFANGGAITSCSIYNRDGTNFWGARIWIDTSPATGSINLWYLSSAGSWVQFDTWIQNAQFHGYQPDIGLKDKVGEWFYVKLLADMKNKVYSTFQFNDRLTTFASGTALRSVADTGPQDQHFSLEFGQNDATRRYINVAQVVGSQEA